MPGDTPTLADVDRTIDRILAPLREQLMRVDNELAGLDARKAELKEVRTKINRIIGANNKVAPWGSKTGRKNNRPSNPTGVSVEKQEAVLELAKEYDGEFTTLDLRADYDIQKATGIGSDAGLSKALSLLHDRGALRLVRQGGVEGVKGNRVKVWEVTKHA
jgi:hypothetical protein